MCGFLGEYSEHDLSGRSVFERLLSISKHRGPDNQSILKEVNFQLGFNRLAIQDLSEKGNQPMWSPSRRYIIVYNGEIYNFLILKEAYNLENLKSHSDTEVILHLIDLLGVVNTIAKLDGMFSMAIIDTEENKVYLTRDFAGIKPLFYGVSEKGLIFASQFNQVFKHPFFKDKNELRKEIVKEYFGLGYMQAPNTIYKNIFQVEPGELLIFEKGVFKERQKLMVLESKNKEKEFDLEKYHSILQKSIGNQMISDVPLASFLSGGIDSPLITAIAHQENNRVEAFTFGIDDANFDESKKAVEYSKNIGVKHEVEMMNEKDLLLNIDEHFKYFGEPFGDYSSIPTYLITQMAQKNYTVMLSGDGADELFFGYPRMQDIINKKKWFYLPYKLRKFWIRLSNRMGFRVTWAPITFRNYKDFYKGKHSYLGANYLDKIVPNCSFSKQTAFLFDISKNESNENILAFSRWSEFYGHLQRVLIKVDRMSMAHSMEVRVPYLSKESLKYAWKYMPSLRKNKFTLKEPLKNIFTKYIPKDLIESEKKGFSVPMKRWLYEELKNDVEKMVFETELFGKGIVNEKSIQNYVADFYNGKHQEYWGVWHIYAWQKWAFEENLI